MAEIEAGLEGRAELVVGEDDTAARVGSGALPVLATPAMVALIERAAVAAVEHRLPPGSHSVGVALDVSHLAATPVGGRVTARARLTEVEGRKLTFEVEASDEAETIGRGVHRRVVVEASRFMARVEAKRAG